MFDVASVASYPNSSGLSNETIEFGAGGYQGCRGGPGQDWFVENVLELLDNENEHYIDTDTSPPTLYYQPNSTAQGNPPPADLQFEVPVLKTLVCKMNE